VEKLIIKNFIIINDFDLFQLPTNIIRAHVSILDITNIDTFLQKLKEKKNIASIKPEEREALLFDHFLIVCRRVILHKINNIHQIKFCFGLNTGQHD
jgi:hypothetical protein